MDILLSEEITNFISSLDPKRQTITERFIDVLLAVEPQFEVAMKWKRPTFTLHGNWNHWICAIQPAKGQVSLEFHKGALLDDPEGVLTGTARYPRRVTVPDVSAVDAKVLEPIIRDAVEKQTEM